MLERQLPAHRVGHKDGYRPFRRNLHLHVAATRRGAICLGCIIVCRIHAHGLVIRRLPVKDLGLLCRGRAARYTKGRNNQGEFQASHGFSIILADIEIGAAKTFYLPLETFTLRAASDSRSGVLSGAPVRSGSRNEALPGRTLPFGANSTQVDEFQCEVVAHLKLK